MPHLKRLFIFFILLISAEAWSQEIQLIRLENSELIDPYHHGMILEYEPIRDPNFEGFEAWVRYQDEFRDQTWKLYHPHLKPYLSNLVILPYRTEFIALRADRPYCFRIRALYGELETPWIERCPVHFEIDQEVGFEQDTDEDGIPDFFEWIHGTDPRNPDTDGDGLNDGEELQVVGSDPNVDDSDQDGILDGHEEGNPLRNDSDNDGLTDDQEIQWGTDPNRRDSDGDGLLDGEEVHQYHTNPAQADSDFDGLDDRFEIFVTRTDPNHPDSDLDGLPDGEEVENGLQGNEEDADGDGLSDYDEVQIHRTNPNHPDTDGDGLNDGDEIARQTNPLEPDTDGDGLNDGEEVHHYRSNPLLIDTDEDGLEDGEEVEFRADPTMVDTDQDGLTDFEEVRDYGTKPDDANTDNDGLTDAQEVRDFETDPLDADTDNDNIRDGDEVRRHQTNPRDPDTDGDGLRDDEELFEYGSNPKKVNTDEDCMNDGDEVAEGRDPVVFEAPVYEANPRLLNFAWVNKRGRYSKITIKNRGDIPLKLNNFQVEGQGFFNVLDELQILPGETKDLPVLFRPLLSGIHHGNYTYETNDCFHEPLQHSLMAVSELAEIEVEEEELNFRRTGIWSYQSQNVTVRNTSPFRTLPITLKAIRSDDRNKSETAFYPHENHLILQPGEERVIPVEFHPYRFGTYKANLLISSFWAQSHIQKSVRLKGVAAGEAPEIEVSRRNLIFPEMPVGQYREEEIIIRNRSETRLYVDRIYALENDNSEEFRVADWVFPEYENLIIDAGESHTLKVRFRGEELGFWQGFLRFVTYAWDENREPTERYTDIPLEGRVRQ